ncbi:hypothetical protein J2X55_001319 [Microbacterium sp. 1154]|uniref:hypothetical protein n=1 Tax=Microbacterium sp. 1154 TaxID=2817733 RepID=UPI0028574252|nr:hypothetical protein [Microbacterium sp. 1154]MDR6690420.1 hypothetical protein [Microbacterium sp. 1154]
MIRPNRRRRVAAIIAAWACGLALLVAAPIALPATVAPVEPAAAANAADWNPGNIIDDAVFYDGNAMGSPEIQAFMERQVRNCQSGYTCVKDYRQNTDNRPVDKYCNGYAGAANESASTIIDKVARSCGISQKALLVLLQKEQGLITSTAPSAWNYSAATGQGCPDTAPCDAATAGFFYQVYYAARQFEVYRLNPTWWGYQSGRWNNILYNPNGGCGTQRVYIENQATAGLYIYTPYVPNQAALNNLYGTGDGCSAYGNRNFWRTFTDWFGSTRVPSNPNGPFGSLEAVTAVPGGFRVAGWTIDPDSAASLDIQVSVEGTVTTFRADTARPDVGASYPDKGANHGFSVVVPAAVVGDNNVCVTGVNVGQGSDARIGCAKVTAMAGSPIGYVEAVTAVQGGISVAGWALDPDSTSSIDVHVYVDGVGSITTANLSRPDVASAYPAYGAAHGFSRVVAASPGTRNVCLYAINTGLGDNTQLGCRNVDVGAPVDRGRAPIGAFDAVTVDGANMTISGWAIDPDTAAPVEARVTVTNYPQISVRADANRPDVGAAYPMYGPAHGFVTTTTVMGGTYTVCVTAVNTGAGGDSSLGCKNITVPVPDLGRAPIGYLDSVSVTGNTVRVSGWALDLDTTSPIQVHIYVGNSGVAYRADGARPDVGAAYPLQGPTHGFDQTMTAPVGQSSVCVYGINNGAGGNALIGCRTITVADHTRPPIGNLEYVGVSGRSIVVAGWAFDPDTTSPIDVHVYIDGVGRPIRADAARPDVAAAYPGTGSQHGFTSTFASTSGSHTVCVYPINDVTGPNTFLGCRTVTIP